MPMYTYQCSKCGVIFETFKKMSQRKRARCNCGASAKQTVGKIGGTSVFDGHFEHITSEPIEAKNKKELREICKHHGCYAPGVID